MIPMIQPVLFSDPQDCPVVCLCERCGGECYHPSRLCPDCEDRP